MESMSFKLLASSLKGSHTINHRHIAERRQAYNAPSSQFN
jgi:hypothetical protein